jgi:hypothetical protein
MENVSDICHSIGIDCIKIEYDISDKLCNHCKIRKPLKWAKFNCHHKVCSSCLDDLYDNSELYEYNGLFNCPFCNNIVTDFEFL